MSVVNKMLQDLEQRNEQPEQTSADYQPAPKARFSKRGTVIIAVLTLVVAGYVVTEFLAMNKAATDVLQDAANKISGITTNDTSKSAESSQEQNEPTVVDEMPASKENLAAQDNNESQSLEQPVEAVVAVAEKLVTDKPLTEIDEDIHQRNPEAFNQKFEALAGAYSETAERVPLDGSELEEPTSPEVASGELLVSRVGEQTLDEKLAKMIDKANMAINAEQAPVAINILDQALEIAPERHDIRKRLAVVLFANQQDTLAETVLHDGVSLAPDRVDLRLMLGRMLHRQKKMQSLYDLLKPLTPSVELHSEYLALQAAAAHQLGHYDEAALLFSQLVEFDASRSNWWLGLAVAQDKQSHEVAALKAYRKVVQLQQVSQAVLNFVENRIGILEN